jgi:thiamine-monophosphate kinase
LAVSDWDYFLVMTRRRTTDQQNSESSLLARITGAVPSAIGGGAVGVPLGIGDDAAIVKSLPGKEIVASSDFFLEGRHFVAATYSPESVGYKSLARAVSDLAAMGAVQAGYLLNLALPTSMTGAWLDGFLRGLRYASRNYRIRLIGGDLARSERVVISITVLGYVSEGRALRRDGAAPGDLIYVTGILGAARLGLEMMRQGKSRGADAKRLLRPHLYPHARLVLGEWLVRRRVATAAIDISDGLAIDLSRICEASGVGAAVEADRVPRVAIPPRWQARLHLKPSAALDFALHGGDDYELLFTVPRRCAPKLARASRPRGIRLSCIGEITRKRQLVLIGPDGRTSALSPDGWDHFR